MSFFTETLCLQLSTVSDGSTNITLQLVSFNFTFLVDDSRLPGSANIIAPYTYSSAPTWSRQFGSRFETGSPAARSRRNAANNCFPTNLCSGRQEYGALLLWRPRRVAWHWMSEQIYQAASADETGESCERGRKEKKKKAELSLS